MVLTLIKVDYSDAKEGRICLIHKDSHNKYLKVVLSAKEENETRTVIKAYPYQEYIRPTISRQRNNIYRSGNETRPSITSYLTHFKEYSNGGSNHRNKRFELS